MLESALTSGICSMGVDVLLVGPLPTPGIAFLTRSMRADAGVVISASHNPFQDNGIKFFAGNGFKLPDERRARDRAPGARRRDRASAADRRRRSARRSASTTRSAATTSSSRARSRKHLTLDGLHDRRRLRPRRRLSRRPGGARGARRRRWSRSASSPTARTSTATAARCTRSSWPRACARRGAHLGVALDGDADRAIFVDEHGEVVDGDEVLAMLGIELHRTGPPAERRRRRHRDEQPRPRPGAARARHRAGARAGRRPLRGRGDAARRLSCSAASSPATSSSSSTAPPATAW